MAHNQTSTDKIEDIDEKEDIIEVDDGTTGFEKCTEDLVQSQETKGKVVVSTVLDGESEIVDFTDFSDISEPIHFEILDDPDIDNNFFEQCGRCKDVFDLHDSLTFLDQSKYYRIAICKVFLSSTLKHAISTTV